MSPKAQHSKKKEISAPVAELFDTNEVVKVSKPKVSKTVSKRTAKPKASKIIKSIRNDAKKGSIPSIFAPRKSVSHTDILMSVDIERKGLASVSKYAGLFFVLVGFVVSSMSLSGMYVDGVELALNADNGSRYGTTQTAETIRSQIAVAVSRPADKNVDSASDREGFSGVTVGEIVDNKSLISVTALNATGVGFYVKTANIVTERYLGRALEASSTEWSLLVNTVSLPTNEYEVFAKITTLHGAYVTPTVLLEVVHQFTISSTTQNELYDALTKSIESVANDYDARDPKKDIFAELKSQVSMPEEVVEVNPPVVSTTKDDAGATSTATVAEVRDSAETVTSTSIAPTDFDIEATNYERDFNSIAIEIAYAVHLGNSYGVEVAKTKIMALGEKTTNSILSVIGANANTLPPEYLSAFTDRYRLLSTEAAEREVKKQNFIYERVGSTNFVDTDGDRLSDYDEYVLNTNSSVADTDYDGFTDYFEVTAGSNPLSAVNTVLTVNDSPVTAATTAELLDATITFVSGTTDESGVDGSLLSGVALKDSYVSLYFPSLPITAWVRTDENGVWNYKLSNLDVGVGQYEAVVGLMDSTGRIMALSKPLKFAKTANGFSSFRPLFHGVPQDFITTSVFSKNLLSLAYALTVLILGICLMLLGLHLSYHSFRSTPKLVKS